MTEPLFGLVNSNRAGITKYVEFFKKNKQGDECLISPRPKPGGGFSATRYFVLLKFTDDTKNRAYFLKQKNFKRLTEDEYNHERASIEYFWEA